MFFPTHAHLQKGERKKRCGDEVVVSPFSFSSFTVKLVFGVEEGFKPENGFTVRERDESYCNRPAILNAGHRRVLATLGGPQYTIVI